MRYTKALVVLLFLLAAGSRVQGQSNGRGCVPSQDVEVYRALLSLRASEGAKPVTIGERTVQDLSDDRKPKQNLADVRGVFPELQDDAARNFLKSNSKSFLVPSGVWPTSMVAPDEQLSIAGPTISFSRVGFNRTATQAFLYGEWSDKGSGAGTYYLLSRAIDGSWLLVYKYTSWRSQGTRVLP